MTKRGVGWPAKAFWNNGTYEDTCLPHSTYLMQASEFVD